MTSIWPELSVRRGREAVAWYRDVFGAVEEHRVGGTDEDPAVGEQHGWVLGRIEDPYGHGWEIGRPLGTWPGA